MKEKKNIIFDDIYPIKKKEKHFIIENFSENKNFIKEENDKNIQNNFKNLDGENKFKPSIVTTIESDESNEIERQNYAKNKLDILYQISENKDEGRETVSDNSDSNSENENDNNIKKRAVNLKKFKTLNYKKPSNKYDLKIKDRKSSRRLKKLGTNIYDFII